MASFPCLGLTNASHHASQGTKLPILARSARELPELWRGYQYFRRQGFRAREAGLLARAESWAGDQGFDLEHGSDQNGEPLVALSRKVWRDAPPEGWDGHHADANWELTPMIAMMRPGFGTDRAVAALMAMILKETIDDKTNASRRIGRADPKRIGGDSA